MTSDFERRWERIQEQLRVQMNGDVQPRVSSGRTLFGIKSESERKMDEFARQIEAEQAAKRRERERECLVRRQEVLGGGPLRLHRRPERGDHREVHQGAGGRRHRAGQAERQGVLRPVREIAGARRLDRRATGQGQQGPNSVKAGVFRRAPAFHGLYPKSKPPAMRVVLILGLGGLPCRIPSSNRTRTAALGRRWWWGRRRRLRRGTPTGARWPCACRSRFSRALPASSCVRPAQARTC